MKRGITRLVLLIILPLSVHADINTANQALARGDYDTAVREFRYLAEQGNARAQAHLGYMYFVGEGVRQDYGEAIRWYRAAANQGDKDAQYNLAVAYAFGEGVSQDYRQAISWYRLAAEQGHVMAQYSLGISYTYGEGVEQNPREAAKWFTRAAEQGYDRAQVQLGSKYHTGEGVPQDFEQAAKWYRMAADRGNAAAQFNLGTLYRSGMGVLKDYNQARRWFRLAADQGYVAAQNELASIERVMAGSSRSVTAQESSPAPVSRPQTIARSEPGPSTYTAPAQTESITGRDEPDLLTLGNETTEAESGTEDTGFPAADAETSDTLPMTEDIEDTTEKKPGFFSRLFGRKQQRPEMEESTGDLPVAEEEVAGEEIVPADQDTEIEATTTVAEEDGGAKKPLFGLFGRLFNKKDKQPEDTGESAAETTDSGSYEEPAMTARADDAYMDDEEESAVEENQGQSGGWSPSGTYSEEEYASEDEIETDVTDDEAEKKSRFGFLGRLFGRKNNEPDSEEPEPVITDEETVAMVDEPAAGLPADEEIASEETGSKKRGFFGRLFSKSADDEQQTESATETSQDDESSYESESYSEDTEYSAEPDELKLAFAALENNNYDDAFSQFRSLAVMGDPASQYQLGSLYYQGLGTQRDYYEAARWYRRAADQGNVDAQYSLGNMYLMGEGIEQDDTQAAEWYEKAAAQGHESARHNLENLERVTRAQSEEMVTYKGASEEEVSALSEEKDTEKKSRFGFFKNLFKKDSTESEDKAETTVDTAESSKPIEDVIEESGVDFVATEDAGNTESNPEPTEEKSEKKGFFSRWFGKDKNEQGETETQEQSTTVAIVEPESSTPPVTEINSSAISDYETGNAYSFGEGVSKDSAEAFKWYLKSAQQGYAPAQYKVGSSYAYGDGVERDPLEATNWYRQAARQGYTLAQRNLGMMYSSGNGIKQDKALGLAWYSILAEQGNVMDIRRRDLLESELSEEERERARELKENLISYINSGSE